MSKLVEKEKVIDTVMESVREYQSKGEIDLPKNYSPENAMKSAWLKLQEVKTKNKKPVLKACSKSSIINSLLKMVVLGLNPEKEQGYFIPYGNTLTFQPGYFGNVTIAKRVANAEDVYAQAIYSGDEVDYEIKNGRTIIKEHNQSFKNKAEGEVVGAYAIIEFEDERPSDAEIMTIDQLKSAWKQGNVYKENGDNPHNNFTEEMAKKTVTNRICKKHINSSDDSNIITEAVEDSNMKQVEHETQEEIEENANSEVIDVEPEPIEKEQEEDSQEQQAEEQQEQDQEPEQQQLDATGTESPGF